MTLDYQLVIPMSGRGSRFKARGYNLPKYLLPVGRHSVLQHTLESFNGVTEVLLIVNSTDYHRYQTTFDDLVRHNSSKVSLSVIDEHDEGPGGAILRSSDLINKHKPIVANYCDFGWTWNLSDFLFLLETSDGVVATYTGFHPHMLRSSNYAYAKISDRRISEIREKASFTNNRYHEHASSGTYGFKSGQLLLSLLEEQKLRRNLLNGEMYLSLTYLPLIEKSSNVQAFEIDHFFQWGTPDDYEQFLSQFELFEYFASNSLKHLPVKKRSVVLLAAGKGERFQKARYSIPKPALELSGAQSWLQALRAFGKSVQSVCVSRNELKAFLGPLPKEVDFVFLDEMTIGQAKSAQFGLDRITDETSEVVVASCDALFAFGAESSLPIDVELDLVVWTAKPTVERIAAASQYCWVQVDSQRRVLDVVMKSRPPSFNDWEIVTGTFTFSNRAKARMLVDTVLDSELEFNGEKYLDFAIQLGLRLGLRVGADLRTDFVGIGTPEEYESFRYWQSAFDKWSGSTYKIELDPFLEPKSGLFDPQINYRHADWQFDEDSP